MKDFLRLIGFLFFLTAIFMVLFIILFNIIRWIVFKFINIKNSNNIPLLYFYTYSFSEHSFWGMFFFFFCIVFTLIFYN